ncbi:MAG TPA: N-acetylglucosamine-6-phosphate deacetylase [Clostridiaceae bacterium]|nr:N-acetylglucosamine-6-phosphate deacetylase [Clostridiaceae bacterium]
MKIKIINGKVLTPYRIINDGTVLIDGGRIKAVGDKNEDTPDYTVLDAKGNYIAPGFIDIHTHGGGGHDFLDSTVEAFIGAAEKHAQHGTTALSPTTAASNMEELKRTFEVYEKAKKIDSMGASFIGLHLEGPYFSMEQRGAQDPRYIKNPDPKEYKEVVTWSKDIFRWSAAPELDGALEFGAFLRDRGILPSVAHSDAVYEQVLEAFEYGFTHMTHLYSGMSGVRRINAFRYAGVIESAYLIDEMTVEIIADGCHLPASLLKMIYKIKGPEHIALITDSMRAAGQLEGESILGSLEDGQRVIIEDGVAKLPDRKSFAGSVATCDRLVRNMVNLADVPLIDAVRMMTSTPARIAGLGNSKGSIVPGKDADIVIFDNNINVKMTIVQGKIIFDRLSKVE